MYFLSIESSTKNFALAVSCDDKVLRYKTVRDSKRLEDLILPTLDGLLKLAKVPFKKIDAFVVSLGPGSFTSLRVGLSTVKAFCMATKKPMVGICSLDILAHGTEDISCDEICVIIDARRSLVYSAIYRKTAQGLKISAPYALSPLSEVLDKVQGRTLFVGDALALYQTEIKAVYQGQRGLCQAVFAPQQFWQPKANVLAHLGFKRLQDNDVDDAASIVPIYLYQDACQVQGKEHIKGS